eukprot:2423735-Pyramimonas_sp.AAC.1
MSPTGKHVTDFFRPLTQAQSGSYHSWSCSVHIVSDSTIVFKDASGAPKSSLVPEFNLRQSVFGSVQAAISGAQIKGIAGASATFRRGEQWSYEEGTHTPSRFTFWNFNDIVDNSGKLNGAG